MDLTQMDPQEMQAEMMKRQSGPVFGFAKLRRRTPDIVSEIATKWTQVARTGATGAKFSGVDLSSIMFTMQKGQDTLELKEFILEQPEAYEIIKIGDQLFRRSGDLPCEQVIAKLQARKHTSDDTDSAKARKTVFYGLNPNKCSLSSFLMF